MSSLFGWFSQDLPYSKLNSNPVPVGRSTWTHAHGISKDGKTEVSVFVSSKPDDTTTNAFARGKKLRHPWLLTFLDGRPKDITNSRQSTPTKTPEKYIMVTEKVRGYASLFVSVALVSVALRSR